MIRFKAIRWKNFLSTGNAFTEISFTESKTALILGENGSGKSTLLDALCFGLFGRAYRDINKPQLLNSVNGKKCEVEITFQTGKKEYRILRGIRPNVFEIYVDGELLNQDAATRDYQKYLEESILKLNFKSFTQIVILGTAGFTPFMQLPAAARREIIEDILDIQIFTLMNELLKAKIREAKDNHLQLGRDLDLEKEKGLLQQKYIQTLQENKKDQAQQLAQTIAETEQKTEIVGKQIQKLQKQLEELQTQVDEYNVYELKWDKLDRQKAPLEADIKRLQEKIEILQNKVECESCGQPISAKTKKKQLDELDAQLTDVQSQYKTLQNEMKQWKKKIDSTEWVGEKFTTCQNEVRELQNELSTNQRLLLIYRKQLGDLQKKTADIDTEQTKLKTHAKAVVTLSKKRQEVGEEKYYLEFAGTLLKDSGIKTQIINQYLPVINKLVNKYLAEMDFYVQFTLDDEFKESIRSRFRDEFTYASFSQGEKQRIDLALLFTWRTIAKMKNSASTNLLILDEVFDSSLDANGTEFVMNLLNSFATDSHVFVISHKPELMADKFQRILRFEKKQNFSVLSEET